MVRPIYPKEILYLRVSKVAREYAREMKKYFKSESNYVNRLIFNDRLKHTLKNERIAELAKIDEISDPYIDE